MEPPRGNGDRGCRHGAGKCGAGLCVHRIHISRDRQRAGEEAPAAQEALRVPHTALLSPTLRSSALQEDDRWRPWGGAKLPVSVDQARALVGWGDRRDAEDRDRATVIESVLVLVNWLQEPGF